MKKDNAADTNLVETHVLLKDELPLNLNTEVSMPVKKCVNIGNKHYSYNEANKKVSLITEQTYNPSECPDNVLADLMAGKYNSLIVINSKNEPLTRDELISFTKAIEGEISH